MDTHFFASTFGRTIASAVLACATFLGTVGTSTVASAQERPHAAQVAPRPGAPRVAERGREGREGRGRAHGGAWGERGRHGSFHGRGHGEHRGGHEGGKGRGHGHRR